MVVGPSGRREKEERRGASQLFGHDAPIISNSNNLLMLIDNAGSNLRVWVLRPLRAQKGLWGVTKNQKRAENSKGF